MVVDPVESRPPRNDETPEVAISEVRFTVWKAAEPETESAAYGEVEPIPSLPASRKVRFS